MNWKKAAAAILLWKGASMGRHRRLQRMRYRRPWRRRGGLVNRLFRY